jgi:2-polyprenyl-3-methyl-5-hydroxy-6-metoxy-1,4-benzoquinol methylase
MSDQNSSELTTRELSEEIFHDAKYANKSGPQHYSKLNPTFDIYLRMKHLLGDISGKTILECGCGDGWITAELVSLGGIVRAFDISNESIKITKAFLEKHNLPQNYIVEKKSAEELDYPDSTFDVVFGFAILHHIDLNKTIPQIQRMLKTSGIAIFAEPLEGNPFISFYRKLTPQYRTPDEHPLKISDFAPYVKEFSNFSHEEFYLTALIPLFLSNFKLFSIFNKLFIPLKKFDKFLLSNFNFLRNWAWYSILIFKK